MSKEIKCSNGRLRELLRSRAIPLTISGLARAIFSNRVAVTLCLNGRRIGTHTWPKLRRVLTAEEFDCAQDFAASELARKWVADHPALCGECSEAEAIAAVKEGILGPARVAGGVMRLPDEGERKRLEIS